MKKRYFNVFMGILVLIIVCTLGYLVLAGNPSIQSGNHWDNSSFPYRMQVNITNNNSILSNYSVLLVINNTNKGNNWNWSDENLVVTWLNRSSNTERIIPFWIEQWNITSNSSRIWAKVPLMYNNTANNTLSIYYGNSTNMDFYNNGTEVFDILFDDMNYTNRNIWAMRAMTSVKWYVENTTLGNLTSETASQWDWIYSINQNVTNGSVETQTYRTGPGTNVWHSQGLIFRMSDPTRFAEYSYLVDLKYDTNTTDIWVVYNGLGTKISGNTTYLEYNVTYNLTAYFSGDTVSVYLNETFVNNITNTITLDKIRKSGALGVQSINGQAHFNYLKYYNSTGSLVYYTDWNKDWVLTYPNRTRIFTNDGKVRINQFTNTPDGFISTLELMGRPSVLGTAARFRGQIEGRPQPPENALVLYLKSRAGQYSDGDKYTYGFEVDDWSSNATWTATSFTSGDDVNYKYEMMNDFYYDMDIWEIQRGTGINATGCNVDNNDCKVGTYYHNDSMNLALHECTGWSYNVSYDWVLIRPFVNQEPQITSYSYEQSYINNKPTLSNFYIKSLTGANLSSETLTAYYSTNDLDYDNLSYVYDWRENNESLFVVNLAMECDSSNLSSIRDYSSYSNNATIYNTNDLKCVRNGGVNGNSSTFRFNGINTTSNLTRNINYSFATNFSYGAWVYVNTKTNYAAAISTLSGSGPTQRGWAIHVGSTPNIGCATYNAGSEAVFTKDPVAFSTDRWYFIVCTRNDTSTTLYVDGIAKASNVSNLSYVPSSPITLGKYYVNIPGFYLNGSIDNAFVINKTLSLYDIQQMNNSQNLLETLNETWTYSHQNYSVAINVEDGLESSDNYFSNNIWINDAPNNVTLLSKTNSSSLDSSYVHLSWSNVTDIDGDSVKYYVAIDNNPSFSSPEFVNSSNTQAAIDTSLVDGTYYWRVLATDTVLNSSWSDIWTFSISTPSGGGGSSTSLDNNPLQCSDGYHLVGETCVLDTVVTPSVDGATPTSLGDLISEVIENAKDEIATAKEQGFSQYISNLLNRLTQDKEIAISGATYQVPFILFILAIELILLAVLSLLLHIIGMDKKDISLALLVSFFVIFFIMLVI